MVVLLICAGMNIRLIIEKALVYGPFSNIKQLLFITILVIILFFIAVYYSMILPIAMLRHKNKNIPIKKERNECMLQIKNR